MKRTKKQKAYEKLKDIPIVQNHRVPLKKPNWIRIQLSTQQKALQVKKLLKKSQLKTVCQEASCPNISECFNCGTATFMIMGSICTRHCAFCDVEHGKPTSLDLEEPKKIAKAVKTLNLKYVVITSVDRDDLEDGGAQHFANCIAEIKKLNPKTKIEILTPDFKHCVDNALTILSKNLPDVFNHNIETIPRLYSIARREADFHQSLKLLKKFKERFPHVSTKTGLMVGLGETDEEIIEVLKTLRDHNVECITIGQYLQPTMHHMFVDRYVTPKQFSEYAKIAKSLGFTHIASGPLVRSSYHADKQNESEIVP